MNDILTQGVPRPVAPEHIWGQHVDSESNYWARVRTTDGSNVSPAELQNTALRFNDLAQDAYGRPSRLKVMRDRIITAQMGETYVENEGSDLQPEILNDTGEIGRLMSAGGALALEMIVRPPASSRTNIAFAKLGWRAARPDQIGLYAQGPSADGGVAEEYLYQHMFYVPKTAPSDRLAVDLGIHAASGYWS